MKTDLRVKDVMSTERTMLWGDLWDDEEVTFTVRNFQESPVHIETNNNVEKQVVYYTPTVVFDRNDKYFIKQGERVTIHLPKKAIGDSIVHSLRNKGLLDCYAKITIRKKSFKKAYVVSVRGKDDEGTED